LLADTFASSYRFTREGIHDFKMEFSKEPNPNPAQYGETWELSWLFQDSDLAIRSVIPASVFTHGNDLLRQPFQYFVDPPSVAYARPLNGPARGGTPIRIFGSNFGEREPEICTRTVFIGSTGVDSDDGRVQWRSSSSITAFAAPGIGCCHNVTVLLLGMESEPTPFARFTYDAPGVTGVRLANAAASGEGIITVIGSSFGVIDYTPASRIGGTACISTSWLSDSSLECAIPSGNNDGDDPDMGILVTVGRQILRPGATFTRGFTYDEPIMSTIAPSNAHTLGAINVTVFGYAIAPTYDPSPEARLGGSAAQNTVWLSESSIQCMLTSGISKGKSVTISVEMHIDTTSEIFSYDQPSLIPIVTETNKTKSYNQPPSFNQTIITVTGINFGYSDRTVRARIAVSDSDAYITNDHKKNRGTGTVYTAWISDSSLTCKAAVGTAATQKITVTSGLQDSQILGQLSEVFSYDSAQVSSASPTGLKTSGSASYENYLGSCKLGTAGGYYSSKFIAQYVCGLSLNLGACPRSSICPCLGVYEDVSTGYWRLCYRLNWNGTMALPLSMCDGVIEGELAPRGPALISGVATSLRCDLLSVHVGHVETYCKGCDFCQYVTNAMVVMGLNFGLHDSTPRSRIYSTSDMSTRWFSDSSIQLKAPEGKTVAARNWSQLHLPSDATRQRDLIPW
jgi:hypothetical protein